MMGISFYRCMCSECKPDKEKGWTPPERLAAVLERKCNTDGCYHWRVHGYIYCTHCLHGPCVPLTSEDVELFKRYVKPVATQEGEEDEITK